jgi:hypothetical protein
MYGPAMRRKSLARRRSNDSFDTSMYINVDTWGKKDDQGAKSGFKLHGIVSQTH